MKALVKAKAEKGIWLQDIPEPIIGNNDVLIKIKKTAICGTDLHIYNWDAWAQRTVPIPMAIGHEFVGEIVALGSEVSGLRIGQRVSGEGHITCGHCRNCQAGKRHLCRNTIGLGYNCPGCFAEYLSLPAANVYPLSDNIPDDIAAILDPLGNAVHIALSFDLVGEDVLITGAGPVGLMAAAIAKKVGARYIIIAEINPYRLELAEKMGVSRAINPQKTSLPQTMRDLDMREGFDVGLEISGSGQALTQMLEQMNHGGRVAILGIPPTPVAINWDLVIFKSLTLKGVYGREIFDTWHKMTMLLESGLNIAPVITHHFPYIDYREAFETAQSGRSGKVILEWQ